MWPYQLLHAPLPFLFHLEALVLRPFGKNSNLLDTIKSDLSFKMQFTYINTWMEATSNPCMTNLGTELRHRRPPHSSFSLTLTFFTKRSTYMSNDFSPPIFSFDKFKNLYY